mmetsp:Transcript_12946/g.27490  ORF Transcript_12946/g.27490 Transcript_12946/m.27490 type:complete len:142 (+) Transcript_12946:232-657(+)
MPGSDDSSAAFAKHKPTAADETNKNANEPDYGKMSLGARFLIFVFVPCFTGVTGLGISYLESLKSPAEGEEQHVVDFDRDFVTPFLLALALVVVLGFQTNGFSPGAARKSAFVWPKARTVQRVRRERVVVEDEDVGGKKDQ